MRVLSSLGELSLPRWEALHAAASRKSPFLTPAFLLPWAGAFARNRPVAVFLREEGDRLSGALFACGTDREGEWELLGGEPLADSLDALLLPGAEGPFWEEFLKAFPRATGGRRLTLPSVVEGSRALDLLPSLAAARGVAFSAEEQDRSPFVELPSSFDGYLASLGKKERHELRRKLRRAEEAVPGLSLRVTATEGELLGRDLPSFLALHRASAPEKARFMDDAMAAFFTETARAFLRRGELFLAFLGAPGGPDLAAGLHFRQGRSLLLYNSGFDPARRDANAGIALVARCVERAVADGVGEYDFLRGTERYKYDLGGRDRVVHRLRLSFP
jgi:CelD/BcsL family acetyltransferase involved in cellulose biosynthesis